jgi:hypothetical protein
VVWPPRACVDEDVGWLHVPVHEPGRVRRVKRRRDRGQQERGPLGRKRPLPVHHRAQVATGHIPHREIQDPVGLAGPVDGDDVRMVNRRGRQRLPDEPLTELAVPGQRRRENLQRDCPAQPLVPGPEHHGHSTGPDPRFQVIPGHHRPRRQPGKQPAGLPGRRLAGHPHLPLRPTVTAPIMAVAHAPRDGIEHVAADLAVPPACTGTATTPPADLPGRRPAPFLRGAAPSWAVCTSGG